MAETSYMKLAQVLASPAVMGGMGGSQVASSAGLVAPSQGGGGIDLNALAQNVLAARKATIEQQQKQASGQQKPLGVSDLLKSLFR